MGQGIGFSYLINPTSLAPHSTGCACRSECSRSIAHSLLGPQAISGGTAGRFLWAPATSLIVEERPTWRLSDPIRLVAQLPGDIATPLQTDGGPPYVPTTLEYLPQGPRGRLSSRSARRRRMQSGRVLCNGCVDWVTRWRAMTC
jgi:hypothetical protein